MFVIWLICQQYAVDDILKVCCYKNAREYTILQHKNAVDAFDRHERGQSYTLEE